MAQKRTRRAGPTSGEGSQHGATKSRSQKLLERSQRARFHALHVLADLRRNPSKTLSQAASDREVSVPAIRRYIGSQLRQDRPGGRIHVTKTDRLSADLYIPTTKPDVFQKIHTRSSRQRYQVGEWQAAINEAGNGDFGRIGQFPKNVFIDGVRLATSPHEVQRILEAVAETEGKLESLYSLGGGSAA